MENTPHRFAVQVDSPSNVSASETPTLVDAASSSPDSAQPDPLLITDAEQPASIRTPVGVVTPAEAAALALTGPQRCAIIQMTSGRTRADAARAAGVTRTTLYRWLNTDSAFQAAFNLWQKDAIGPAQAELLAATRDAVTTVIQAIRNGDAKLAWKLLQAHGLTATPTPGPTEVEELERRLRLDQKKHAIALRRENNQVQMDDLTTLDDF